MSGIPASKINELIEIVDKDDKSVGTATKPEAWKEGLIHRVVRIVVEDDKGRVLLQKRSLEMELYPGCWNESASGHVDAGEAYEVAAMRELAEEVGLNNLQLQEIGYYYWEGKFDWRILKRFCKVYKAVIPTPVKFNLEKIEVSKVQWFTPQDVKELVRQHPDRVSDGLAQLVEKHYI